MRSFWGTGIRPAVGCAGLGMTALTLSLASWAQSADSAHAGCFSGEARGRIVREVRDPRNGARWLLVRNTENPGGPGRMILAGPAPREQVGIAAEPESGAAVIHPGERLVVEEHTATAFAVLEGTAVDCAAIGARLAVRLKIGGRVVKAVATGPGRAALAPLLPQAGEARP
jgi:hypothetical protein